MTLGIGFMLILWSAAVTTTLYGTFLAVRHSRVNPVASNLPYPSCPVSILKPIKGIDDGLQENLESFFLLNYPEYELLFSIPEANDPAASIIKALIQKYPKIPTRLFTGQVMIGPNPKINNLFTSYQNAKNDCILISDSNVRVEPDYLTKLIRHLTPEVGIVTSVVAGERPLGLGGHLEAMYLNTYYARGMHLTKAVKHPTVMGKSMIFKRSVAERFGGMQALSCYLAEDYMAGEAMLRLGLQVAMATDPIRQYIGRYSLQLFLQRHIRWGRIRKSQEPIAFYLEPYISCLLSGIIGTWGFHRLLGISPLLLFGIHLTLWMLFDLTQMRSIRVKLTFYTPFVWLLREFISIPMWIWIAAGNTVSWRGKTLKLQAGGVIRSSPENSSWSCQHVKIYT